MNDSVALGVIMEKLNIQFPSLLEQIRPEIPTPLLMPTNKTKGEIEARLSRSSTQNVQAAEKSKTQEVDIGMERLIKAAEGPSLSREFDELLKALRDFLNNNFFTYKKALDKIIKSIRVILIPRQCVMANKKLIMTLETELKVKRNKTVDEEEIIKLLERYLRNAEVNLPKTQINKDNLDDDKQKKDDQKPSGSNPTEWLIEREDIRARNKAESEERIRKYNEEIEMYMKRSEELKAKGMSKISKDGKFLNIKAGKFIRFKIDLLNGYPETDKLKLVEALSETPIIEELEILVYLKDLISEETKAKQSLPGASIFSQIGGDCCARHACTITRLSQIDNPKVEESTDGDTVILAHYAPKDPSEYTEPEK
ncbi:hypothetical protein AgCh_013039 [Apium graveolens]